MQALRELQSFMLVDGVARKCRQKLLRNFMVLFFDIKTYLRTQIFLLFMQIFLGLQKFSYTGNF